MWFRVSRLPAGAQIRKCVPLLQEDPSSVGFWKVSGKKRVKRMLQCFISLWNIGLWAVKDEAQDRIRITVTGYPVWLQIREKRLSPQ